jgi:hypothetical protein
VEKELFTECFSKLLSDTATAWPALEQVVATLRVQRDATLIARFTHWLQHPRFLPIIPWCSMQSAYLDLIINQSADPSTFASMLSRITSNPNEISFRATYALALLLSGQKGEALLQLQKLQTVDPARLTSDQLAIMAGILAQNGDQILSRRIQTAIPKQTLSEQEWLLLNKNMASLGAPASPFIPIISCNSGYSNPDYFKCKTSSIRGIFNKFIYFSRSVIKSADGFF